jgi:Fe-S-cluster-containing hydrogenase component 2
VPACPVGAISGGPKNLQVIDLSKCIQCDACYQVCKFDAIVRVRRDEAAAVQTQAKASWKPVRQRHQAEVSA